jgi:hypothetical protein
MCSNKYQNSIQKSRLFSYLLATVGISKGSFQPVHFSSYIIFTKDTIKMRMSESNSVLDVMPGFSIQKDSIFIYYHDEQVEVIWANSLHHPPLGR